MPFDNLIVLLTRWHDEHLRSDMCHFGAMHKESKTVELAELKPDIDTCASPRAQLSAQSLDQPQSLPLRA